MADVGTHRVFEDDRVVLWEVLLRPGETLERHSHELPYAFYVLQGSSVKAFDGDGNVVAEVDVPTGEALSFRRRGDEFVSGGGELQVPATHSLQNVGETYYREVLIEFKQ